MLSIWKCTDLNSDIKHSSIGYDRTMTTYSKLFFFFLPFPTAILDLITGK